MDAQVQHKESYNVLPKRKAERDFQEAVVKRLALHLAAMQADVDSIILQLCMADRDTSEIYTDLTPGDLTQIWMEVAKYSNGPRRTLVENIGVATYKVVTDFSGLVYFHRPIVRLGEEFDQSFIAANTRWADSYAVNP